MNISPVQVLKQLPTKKESIEYVEMTTEQQSHYDGLKESLRRDIDDTEDKSRKGSKLSSALMELRKMANHPLLLRRHYDDEKLTKMSHLMLKVGT